MTESIDDMTRQLGELDVELDRLGRIKRPSTTQAARAEAIADETEELRAAIAARRENQRRIVGAYNDATREGRRIPGVSFNHTSKPLDSELFRGGRGSLDDNLRAIDRAADDAVAITGRSADLRPELRQTIERNPEVGDFLRATANPHYRSAFGKLLMAGDPSTALLRFTDAERDAFTMVAEAEQRAALKTGAGSTGTYAVPTLLDPSVILTNVGSVNPIRQIARKVSGVGHTWNGVSSAGITAGWDSQGVEATDGTPTLAQPQVVAHKAQAFAQFSVELEGDWDGLMTELSVMFADARDNLEATAFATGTGTEQPFGILTALFRDSVTASTTVTVTTDGQFGAVDVMNTMSSLGARWRPNAAWVASIDVLNEIRNFGADNKLAHETVDLTQPYSFALLGKPAFDGTGFPDFTGTTGAATLMTLGDFRNYVVFDRTASMRVELVPHLLGSNRMPNGLRGAWAWWRVGADSVNSKAFKFLRNL